jgi:hypothetical protein
VRSISFRTVFFLITEIERSISQPTKYYQPTSVHTPSFVYLWQCTSYNLSCKVSFLYTSWMVEMNRVVIKFCFKPCISATKTLVLVQKAYGNETVNWSKFLGGILDFETERKLLEDDERGGQSKSTRNEVNNAAVTDLVKNGRRIASRIIESLDIPKTVVLRILKEDLGKRKLGARFDPHSLTPEQRKDRVTSCQDIIAIANVDNNFFNKMIRGMRPGVLPMTPKQSDRVLNGFVIHPLGRRNWNSKGPTSRPCW